MISIKSESQIAKMKQAGLLLARCHKEIARRIKPGVTTWEIDQWVEGYLERNGATPEQKGYMGYPYATCASINDEVCHAFPRKNPLKEGDIVTIDMVINLNGWLADSAWTYGIGKISTNAQSLMKVTKDCLYRGIAQAKDGNRIGDIAHAIQSYAESLGYSVVRQFVGHGIGQKIHELPQVPHFGTAGHGTRLREGMVITIEPMINIGSYHVKVEDDGWTAKTVDGSLSAQYEHTIAITKGEPLILTDQS